jgi:FtsP/CotA-like multicopper oxidase with cupredoxin domain
MEDKWMRFQRLYLVLALMLCLAVLSACAANPSSGQSQPETDTPMPGMDHNAMVQPIPQAQPTMDPNMPGMQHAPSAQPESTSAAMPGMEMEGGHDMSPVDLSNASTAPSDARGNQPLEPKLVDGVKEFELTASVIKWNILPDVQVGAYAYNSQVPGPLIRVKVGDNIRVRVKNDLLDPTSVHWHGLILPNAQDGAANVTQPPIEPGETFTYEYAVPNTPGTYQKPSREPPALAARVN